jgi:hypothetical protein
LVVTLLFSIIALFGSCSNLQNYDDEKDFIVTIHGKTAEITGYRGTSTKVNIPPRIGKIPVTEIGQPKRYV